MHGMMTRRQLTNKAAACWGWGKFQLISVCLQLNLIGFEMGFKDLKIEIEHCFDF
jgi:hypothetical protein